MPLLKLFLFFIESRPGLAENGRVSERHWVPFSDKRVERECRELDEA
jgi:hypothetical protein